jgi:site-specific recombinase XerD
MAKVTYLTKEETEAFFRSIPLEQRRDRLLFDLIYRHGLRRQEAALLRTESVKDGRIWIYRLKGGVSGEYALHPTSQELLYEYLQDGKNPHNPFLFNSRQSRRKHPLSTSTIRAAFSLYAKKAGLPAEKQHVHILRHSIAVHLMNAGLDLSDVQDWLGHKAVTSTTVYAKITNKRREQTHEKAINSEDIARTNAPS